MSMLIDIGAIKDEDLLRRMWQDTDDFCRKKEIRAHMYKLRETRLRDFYSGDMDAGIGLSKTPLTSSHGDSLADQSFQSFKTKEIRDSESPTREFKYGVPANLGGWNVMTSSELSNDGKMHTTHSLATTGGVHDLGDGQAKFTGRNEKISSVEFEGDNRNYTTRSGENTNTVLEENIVQGDENSHRVENKKSTVTTSSKIIRSRYESGDNGSEPQYAPAVESQPRVTQNPNNSYTNTPRNNNNMTGPNNNNNNSEQLISRTVEYPDPHTKMIREVKSLPDGSTMTSTRYEPVENERKIIYTADEPKPRAMSAQPNNNGQRPNTSNTQSEQLISRTVEYPDPHTKMIREVKSLPDGSTMTSTRYEPIESDRKIIYTTDEPKPRSMPAQPNNQRPNNSTTAPSRNATPPNDNSEQLISRTVEYPDPHTKMIREVKSMPDGSTVTSTKYETRSANSEVWTSASNTNKNTTSSTSRTIKDDRTVHNRDEYIIRDGRENIIKSQPQSQPQPQPQPNRHHVTNKTTRDVEGYEIIIDSKNDRDINAKTVKKDLSHDKERLTQIDDDDDVMRTTTTTTTTTTKLNKNNDIYDVKRPNTATNNKPTRPAEPEYTRKRISVDLDPTHEAFARSLRCVSPVSDRDSVRSLRSATSSIRSSTSPDKNFRGAPRRSNSRETDISQISSQTVTKSGPTPGLKSTPQQRSPQTKRPTNTTPTTTTITKKPEKIIRIPEDEKPNETQSPVTDLDSDDTTETKTTTVTTTTIDKDQKPKSNRPPFVRSETYEERCRKILGMPEPDEQPKSPVTRRAKVTTTTTDFIHNEKVDTTKNRTVPSQPGKEEKSPSRRPYIGNETSPTRGTPKRPGDEPTINTNTFDRKTPRRPETTGDMPSDEIIETTIVTQTTQKRPNENVRDSKTPTRVLPDHRSPKSPSKVVEIAKTTVTRKTPTGPGDEIPDDKTPQTTKTTVTRGVRRPVDDNLSPDRKSPSRRPEHRDAPVPSSSPDRRSPNRKTVVTTETKVTRKTPRYPNERSPVSDEDNVSPDRKSPSRRPEHRDAPVPSSGPDRRSPNRKTVVTTETKVTRKTPRYPNERSPVSDEDNVSPDRKSSSRRPEHRDAPVPSSGPDRRSPNRKTVVTTETKVTRKTPRYPNERSPVSDEDNVSPDRKYPTREPEHRDAPVPSSGPDRRSPNRKTVVTTETKVTRKTPRYPNEHIPDSDEEIINVSETVSNEDFPMEITERKQPRRPNNNLSENQPETDEDIPITETVITKTVSDRKIPRQPNEPEYDTPGQPSKITDKTSRYPDDRVPTRKSPIRPSEIETEEEGVETTVIRKTKLRPNYDNPEISDSENVPVHPDDETPDHLGRSIKPTKKVIDSDKEMMTIRKTQYRPNDVSPERIPPNRRSPGRNTTTTIREPVVDSKTSQYPEDINVNRKTPDRRIPDRRSPDRPSNVINQPTKSPIRPSETLTDEETVETTVIRKTKHRPNDHNPEISDSEQVPVHSDDETPDYPGRSIKPEKESTTIRKTQYRPNDESSECITPDRRSPGRNTTTIKETVVDRKTPRYPEDSNVNRKTPDRRSPDRPSKETIETTVTKRTPRYPEDILTDDLSPNRQSPSYPNKITTDTEIVETTVIRKTQRSPNDDSPERKSPDHRTPMETVDRPSPNRTTKVMTDDENVETTTTRKTEHRPNDDSPDRKSPGRKTPTADRRSPNRATKVMTDEEIVETTTTRKTQRRPNGDSPDRKSPDRKTPTADRRSPNRATKVMTDEEIVETTTTRKTQRRPNDNSPDRKSPEPKTPTADRRSPNRATNVMTDEEIVETTTTRKTQRRPNCDSPDRKSPDRRTPKETADRRSPNRATKVMTDEEIVETTTTRKTQRKPSDDSPNRKSPDRRTPTKTVDRRSPKRTPKEMTDEEIVETTTTRKTQRKPSDDSPDRKSPDRRTPSETTDRRSPNRATKVMTDEEILETTTTRKIQRRPSDDSPDRKVTEVTIFKTKPKYPEDMTTDRPTHETMDEEIVETTDIRKSPIRPSDSSPDRRVPDRRSPDRKSKPKDILETTVSTRRTPRYPTDSRSPTRPDKITTDEEIVETTVTRKIQRRPNDDSPERKSPTRTVRDRPSSDRKSPTKSTESIVRKTSRQPDLSPDRPSKTFKKLTTTDDEFVETTITSKTQRQPTESPDRKTSTIKSTAGKPKRPTKDNESPDSRSPVRPSKISKDKPIEEITETIVTRKIMRRPAGNESPERKPVRSTTKTTRTDEVTKPVLDRKPIRTTSSKPDTSSPDRTSRRPTTESPTRKTSTTVTTVTTGRRPTPSYTDESPLLRRKPKQNAPEEIVESDEEIDEPVDRPHRPKYPGNTEPGYMRPTKARPAPQSPDRKISTTTFVADTDEELYETTFTNRLPNKESPHKSKPDRRSPVRRPFDETLEETLNRKSPSRKVVTDEISETDEETVVDRTVITKSKKPTDEPLTRHPKNKIIDDHSPDRRTTTVSSTRRLFTEDKSPSRQVPSRSRSPDYNDKNRTQRVTTTKTIVTKQPRDKTPIKGRTTTDDSEIEDETVEFNQYERFIENEIHETEKNRRPSSETPGPFRRKPDDVEVIFERAVDITNLREVDNALIEEEREVGCKLTSEPDEPKRHPRGTTSPTRKPTDGKPCDTGPNRRTPLKKSFKIDDDETEIITTTVQRKTTRLPKSPDTSPERPRTQKKSIPEMSPETKRITKPRSPGNSPVRNIIKTVKEIIISPDQRRSKQPRSPETSPTRRTTHITTITKTIPDRTSNTPAKSRPQNVPTQPGQRKPNLDRINSEIITDRDEKRTTTTTVRSKQKTAPEIVPSIVQRYTTKTESPVAKPIRKKPVESTPGGNEIVEEVFVKKEVKKLCDGDVCGPRPLLNGTVPAKRPIPKQDTPSVRGPSKITEKIDRFTSNNTTTQTPKRSTVTERKNTVPIVPSSRVPATDKFGRSASENQMRTPHAPKIEVNETNKERRPSIKSKTQRPTKCIATKTINITNTNLTVDSDDMDIVIDIQQAKSSREPSPNKMVPVPVSPEMDTGPSRYPDRVTEPEDERKPRRKVTNIPIYEEETNTFVACDITEVATDQEPDHDDLEEGNVDESDDDVDHDRIVKVTDNDECLLSVSDKVSRFINLADETVTKTVTTKTAPVNEPSDRRRPLTKDLENDDCLLSVSDKVNKFILTAEEFKKPKASQDFVTIEKVNEVESRPRPATRRPETEDEIDDEEEIIEIDRTTEKANRVNNRKIAKVETKPSETVITTTTTTTTRKVKPISERPVDEEITVTRPKETKVSTIASKFTKPSDQLNRQPSIKRITTDTKVSSIRNKFDKNLGPEDDTDEAFDEPEDHRYEPTTTGREPFFLNQNGTSSQQIETITKLVQTAYVDQSPDDDDREPSVRGSVTDRFRPNVDSAKVKKITSTPITLQSTEVMKKAKEIFENKPNDRPKQIDILSRPSVWQYKTNSSDVKLTDIGVHTTKKTTTTEEQIITSEEEAPSEPRSQDAGPKTPKLSARDEITLKNLRDVTNISSKKDLFERKFSSDRITTANREFSTSPINSPADHQSRHPPSTTSKPSYMNHTVSSLEHINRKDHSRSHSRMSDDHESNDDTNSINSNKFGVELRRVDSLNATKTRRKSSSTEIPCIEEIWDLELLERMLETVVGYEHRRRIRSQIRIIKKQIEQEEIHHQRQTSRTSSEITKITKERTRSPTSKQRIETVTTTTTTKQEPRSTPQQTRKLSPARLVSKTTRVVEEPDQKVSKVITTTTTITKGGGDITDDGKPIWTKKNLLKKPSETQMKTPIPSPSTTTSSTTRKFNTSSYREVEKTDCVTSSYGIGPTDENGKPLFGIRALKKQAQKTEQQKEPVYTTDSDSYQTDDQSSKITAQQKITETTSLRSPQKIREGYHTTIVKKSTKNFIEHEIADDDQHHRPLTSGTEEIDDEDEYESLIDDDHHVAIDQQHAHTTTKSSSSSKYSQSKHKIRSDVQSFLGSEKTYTGFNDVIDRMQNADLVEVDGDTEQDREARALLNKFLGASILVQATESVLPDGVKLTQKTTRTLKSDSPAATATRQVTTTKLTKVKSSNSNKDSNSISNNNTGAIATTITTTAINDIDSVWDETYLRKLLEQSSSYEERRKIRARIRQIMADKEGGKTTTEIVKETKKDDDGAVTTTTTKVTRTVTASKPVSPFAKFRQLDKTSTQSPPNSPQTPNTPKTPGQTSAPIFKFTDPALNRRVATFKEQLLQWCQIKTKEYENVKIENFSTSWSDGLAFCALIHHFRPDAFDYTKLVATQRRYNFDLAFRVADEKAGIAPLLDTEDMVVMRKPDWKCVFTYVQSIYRRFKDAD